jgi:glycosyltransferase involved in cell wall biosynthesis
MDFLLETNRAPLVDMILVNFNYSRFLSECLASIAAQTYPNWRCSIIDNASTDNSVGVIEEFISDKSDRFMLVRSQANLGQMGGFKLGLEHASGEFVCFVDADDILLPHSVYTHLAGHCAGRPVAFTSARVVVINERGRLIAGDSDHPAFLGGKDYFVYRGRQPLETHAWYWSVTSGMMFRRSVLQYAIPQDTAPFMTCADYFVCHACNLIGGSLLIREPLCLYRVHSRNNLANESVFGLDTNLHDIGRHYDHNAVTRPTMAKQLMAHADDLRRILGEKGFLACFFFVARWAEIKELLAKRVEFGYSRSLVFRTLLFVRSAFLFRRVVAFVRLARAHMRAFIPR